MKTITSLLFAILLSAAFQPAVHADWEIYDDFNDGDIAASKWDVKSFRGGTVAEASGYMALSAATFSETDASGITTYFSGVSLTSRLEPGDVIKGLRMSYLISNYCDASNDFDYVSGTMFSPGRYSIVPVGYDRASLLMSTRSLTQDAIATGEQLITNTRFTFDNSTANLQNGLRTEIWSRFNDDDGYHGYNITNHQLDSTGPHNNDKHTGKWSQITTQFIDPSIITTSASWTNRKTHYEDPAMRLIDNNDPADGPGWFGVANGQFSVWFSAAPKLSGAIKPCKIWLDQIEVYR